VIKRYPLLKKVAKRAHFLAISCNFLQIARTFLQFLAIFLTFYLTYLAQTLQTNPSNLIFNPIINIAP